MPSGFTGPSQIIFTEETDEESGGTLYVTITNDGGTYSSSHTLQEIADAVTAGNAVFCVVGDIVVPLTQISTSGGMQTARFDVLSSIDGYKNITLTQTGDAVTVSVIDSTITANSVKYNNSESGLEASNT